LCVKNKNTIIIDLKICMFEVLPKFP
jgi:hypothetical protein